MKLTEEARSMTLKENITLETVKKIASQLGDSLEEQIAEVDRILDQDSTQAVEEYQKAAGKLTAGRPAVDRMAISYRLRELGMKKRSF